MVAKCNDVGFRCERAVDGENVAAVMESVGVRNTLLRFSTCRGGMRQKGENVNRNFLDVAFELAKTVVELSSRNESVRRGINEDAFNLGADSGIEYVH